MLSRIVRGLPLSAWLAMIAVALIGSQSVAADSEAKAGIKKEVLELTGGRRAKVVWNQSTQDANHNPSPIMLFDTRDDKIIELPFTGTQPWLTPDGTRVLAVAGDHMNRKLMMYNTETRAVTTLCTGPNSFPLCIWRDPKTGRDWVYVNACDAGGEYARNWSDGWDQMFRFPIDNPKSREIFWDRTKSSEFFTLSSDGTRACFAPTFFNIGDLALVYDDKGKINQEKSTFKPVGRGCFPGISPDNSYRMFHLTGNHHSIFMYDSGGANRRSIQLDTLPGAENTGRQVWLTRWSTDPRFLTCMGPADRAGAAIWLGRFDKDFTKIEGWVRISAPGPKCWKSHAWIEPASITGP